MLPTAKNIYSNYTFWNWKITIEWVQELPALTMRWIWAKILLNICPHKVLLWLDDYSDNLGLLESMSFHNQCSVQFSCSVVSNILRPNGLQHDMRPCPSPTPGAYSNSSPLSQWCHPTNSSYIVPFSTHLQTFPASGSFPFRQFFTSVDQSIGISASASALPMNIQDWSRLGWTGWISLQSKELSRVFSNTAVQKHQFFGTQVSL